VKEETAGEPDEVTPDDPGTEPTDPTKENLGLGFQRTEYQTLSIKRLNHYSVLPAAVNRVTITVNDKEFQCSINKAVPNLFAATGTLQTLIDPDNQNDLLSALSYGENKVNISIGGDTIGDIPDNLTEQTITLRDFEIFDWAVLASEEELPGAELTEQMPLMRGWMSPVSGTVYSDTNALAIGFDDIVTY
jgi:hypothetical protein